MFCGNCGTSMPDDMLFCPQCGAKNEELTKKQEKPSTGKKFPVGLFLGCLALCLVLAAAGAGIYYFVHSRGEETDKDIEEVNAEEAKSGGRKDFIYGEILDWSTALFFDVNGKTKEIDDVNYVRLSGDRTKAIYVTDDDSTLYYIDNKLKPVKVADEVLSVQMSMTGDYFAYTTGDDSEYRDCTLYLYDAKKNKSSKISSSVHASYVCISPNGKSVAYVKNYESDADNDLYLSISGEEGNKIAREGCLPVAVSDDGKKLFYLKYDEDDYSYDLQYYNGKESIKIAGEVSTSTMYMNKDVSELIYYKDGKTYYFNTEKKEPLRASINYLYKLSSNTATVMSNSYSVTYDLDSLTNAFYGTDDYALVWLSDDGSETVKVTSKWDDYKVSEDGRTLLYLNKGSLYKAEKFSANAEPKQIYEDNGLDAIGLVTSSDLSRIYLVTEDKELYYYRDSEHVIKISNDLESRGYVAYNELDQMVYFVENDDLYSATTDNKKKKVESNVEGVASFGDFVLYRADDGDALYLLTKNGAIKIYSK